MQIKELPSEYKVPKPYFSGVVVGDFVLLSGVGGIDPETDTVLPTLQQQAEMVYRRIVAGLKVAGTSPEYVIRRTTYLVDPIKNINWKATSTINELMTNHFEDERSQQIYSIIDKSRIMKMPLFFSLFTIHYSLSSNYPAVQVKHLSCYSRCFRKIYDKFRHAARIGKIMQQAVFKCNLFCLIT